jgi:predicted PurR-regulated permease PerM
MSTLDNERERFTPILFYAVVLAIGYLAYRVVAPFLASMAWAAVFAMVMTPLASRLERRMSPTWSATLTTIAAALLIVGPAVTILTILAREVSSLVHEFQQSGYAIPTPARLEELWARVHDRSPVPLPLDLSVAIADGAQRVASFLAGKVGAVLQNLVGLVFQLFIMLFGLFFFLRDRQGVVRVIRDLLPFSTERCERVINETYDLAVATVGSTFAVAATQGALTGLALWALGFRAPVFWGVMTSVFSVIPAVGSGIVWLPAAIWLLASGDVGKGVILIVFGTVVIGMADNVLRPMLLSGRTSMHGLLVFISVMGGVAAFGFIGLALGPIVIATLRTLLDVVTAVEPPAPSETQPPAAAAGA